MHKKLKITLIFLLFFGYSPIFAQLIFKDKISLKTGETYTGEIILQNEEIVLLKTDEGQRFQFPLSEIRIIEKVNTAINEISNINQGEVAVQKGNICGIVELSGGICSIRNKIENSPGGQLSLSFGTRKVNEKVVFIGGGIGYFNIFSGSEIIGFLPVYLKIKREYTSNKISPFIAFDAGYSFSLTTNYKGGVFTQLFVGITRKISLYNSLNFGIYARTQLFRGILTEINEFGSFNYVGTSSIQNLGMSVGFQF